MFCFSYSLALIILFYFQCCKTFYIYLRFRIEDLRMLSQIIVQFQQKCFIRISVDLSIYRLKPAALPMYVCWLGMYASKKRKIPLHNRERCSTVDSIQKRRFACVCMWRTPNRVFLKSSFYPYTVEVCMCAWTFQSERIFCARSNRTIV